MGRNLEHHNSFMSPLLVGFMAGDGIEFFALYISINIVLQISLLCMIMSCRNTESSKFKENVLWRDGYIQET